MVGTVLVVIPIAGFYILRLRKKTDTERGIEDYLEHFSEMPTRFSYEELKLATRDFKKKLGEGGFGSVFEGTLVSGENIAVKRLDALGQGKKEFLAEVKTVGSIHHVNLMMRVAVYKRRSLSTVVKVLEGTMDFEASLTDVTRVTEEQFGASCATRSELSPTILSGPR
ncbi:hypothetical protein Ddye_024322 [Dipteronia dyeriana]|uniref:Protein kinase domain-containing protein n=1 Tax=Dipteronia dyeriana TaxID=168575 RepID=A0AAD9TVJ2_9ROSI|nr:hypothetical protein Ddye_024322 [Dipteronia dyeriana]